MPPSGPSAPAGDQPPVPIQDTSGVSVPDSVLPGVGVADPFEGVDSLVADPPSMFTSWADSVLAMLSLEEKAGQLLMPWILGDFSPDGSAGREKLLEMVEELGLGGVIVSVGSPTEVAVKLNQLQADSKLPLLVAADLERAAGFRFRGIVYLPGPIALGGATEFPSLMAVGATGDGELARTMGEVTGLEARALGVHVPFAPVLDVNNNPDNPIINIRSFGEDPKDVARLGTAFVRGLQDAGAIATGKHFPGHGDTDTDSHLDLPIIDVTRERMDSVELVPFQAVIDEGIGGIMTAHLSIPAVTADRNTPATLSRGVLTGLLREEMGFEGLIFTDAMDMYAIDRRHSRKEAAVRAVEAGADVLLMPADPEAARDGIVEAVEEGRLPMERLDSSVLKILEAKESLGLDRNRLVSIEEVAKKVGIKEHQDAAQEVADRSVTLLKNDGNLLPLLGTRSARVLSVTYRGRRISWPAGYSTPVFEAGTPPCHRDTQPEYSRRHSPGAPGQSPPVRPRGGFPLCDHRVLLGVCGPSRGDVGFHPGSGRGGDPPCCGLLWKSLSAEGIPGCPVLHACLEWCRSQPTGCLQSPLRGHPHPGDDTHPDSATIPDRGWNSASEKGERT
jgi:beta-glucosidase-like glycosyl hydrolase